MPIQILIYVFHPLFQTSLHILIGHVVGYGKTGQRYRSHKHSQKQGYLQIHTMIELFHNFPFSLKLLF